MKPLELGSDGYRVREWQLFLMKQKYLQQGLPMGHFGPLTQQATMNFQKRNGLKDDGKVGPNTINQARRMGFNPTTAHPGAIQDTPSSPRRNGNQEIARRTHLRHYTLVSGIDVPPSLELKISALADSYFSAASRGITITSGRRDAHRQADAMYNNFHKNHSPHYKNETAFRQIKDAYDAGVKANKPKSVVVKEMEAVIQKQINQNVFISNHLLAYACDVRNDYINFDLLKQAATHVGAVAQIEADHYHVQWPVSAPGQSKHISNHSSKQK